MTKTTKRRAGATKARTVSGKVDGEGIVVGAFYELPDGRIAKTYGWSGSGRIVSYAFDDDFGGRSLSEADCSSWKARPDLRDFPNARDPRLPYAFDLQWDIQHHSQLVKALANGGLEVALRRAMAEHGVHLTAEEEAELLGWR